MPDARAPTPLTTPLQCWHESIHSARHDLIVALSERQARIATNRPLPTGAAVFVEFADGVVVDAITTAADDHGFVVDFIAVDDAVAAVLAAARTPMGALVRPPQQGRRPSLSVTPLVAAFLSDQDEGRATPAPTGSDTPRVDVDVDVEAPLPRTRTDRQFLNVTAPEAETNADPAAPSPSPTTHDAPRATNVASNPAPAKVALSSSQPTSGSDASRSSFDLPPTRDFIDRQHESAASSPTWSRSLSMVLGEDAPSSTDQTQRWPIATVAESVGEAIKAAPPTPDPSAQSATSLPMLALNFAGNDDDPNEHTQRWPVAHAKLQEHLRPSAATITSPSAIALDDNGFDVNLDDNDVEGADVDGSSVDRTIMAMAVARGMPPSRPIPIPTPESTVGVIDVDFSEFADVLGVAPFKSEASLHVSHADRGVGVAHHPVSAASVHARVAIPPPPTPVLPKPIDELWVVSPRLVENEFDSMLRDLRPGTPKPIAASASGQHVPPTGSRIGDASIDQDSDKNSTR
jgi:hypothetical protein